MSAFLYCFSHLRLWWHIGISCQWPRSKSPSLEYFPGYVGHLCRYPIASILHGIPIFNCQRICLAGFAHLHLSHADWNMFEKRENVNWKRDFFGTLTSFSCSAGETSKTDYNLRPISKMVFALIFAPSLFFLVYTVSFMPDIGIGQILNTTTLASLSHEDCLSLCNKSETTKNYCGNLWKYLGNDTSFNVPIPNSESAISIPQTHGIILIVLSVLFILSILEGLLEICISCMPYRSLMYMDIID